MTVRMSREVARRLLRITAQVLLSAGLIGLIWYGVDFAQRIEDERHAEHEFAEQLVAARHAAEPKHEEVRDKSTVEPTPKRDALPSSQAESTLVGRIEIPRAGVSAIIREGVDSHTLGRGVGHVPGTAFPGKAGNVALAAHRDRHFRGLRNIQIGDEIRLETTQGTYRYHVESTRIVLPSEVSVLDPTPEPSITLITCYPFSYIGPAPERFIVRGRQVDPGTVTTMSRFENREM